jgi:hypothetical protein
MNLKNLCAHWRAGVLGAVYGFFFGGFCEIANRTHFEFQARELVRISAEGGPDIDIWYHLHWWALPCLFMLVFAIVSPFVHWIRSKRSSSIKRLWQEVGFAAVSVCVLPTLAYGWLSGLPINSEIIVTILFLFGLAFAFSFIFAAFLQMVANYRVR